MSIAGLPPIACELPPEELKDREHRWRTLLTTSLIRKSAIDNGVRLELDGHLQTAHTALDLVSAERVCCAWASWTVLNEDGGTVVEVTADEPGARVVQAMFNLNPATESTA
ncbi:MAG TPA: hypothetical protein VMV93_00355 [Chloroflexota bacterium]|nr:hypothetical protein [Chloroflexota bacterium]